MIWKTILIYGLLVMPPQRGHHNKSTSLTVSAGNSQTITLPAAAALTGSYTVQPPGANVNVTWSKSSGTGVVTFANAKALATTATFSAAGSYVLTLAASSGKLRDKSSTTITVNGPNITPTPTPTPAPTPPIAKLAWNAVTGATSYNVYRGPAVTGPFTILSGGTGLTTTTYNDATVVAGSTYYYTVRAVNSVGESANSNVIQYTAQ